MSDLLVEGFESGSDQNLSGYNSWTGTSTAAIYIDTGQAYAGSRSVHITPNAGGSVVNYKAFSSAQSGSVFTVDFWLYVDTAPTSAKPLIIPSYGAYNSGDSGTYDQKFNISVDGSIRREYTHIAYATIDDWTHVEIQYNLDENPDTFDIWVDDTHYGPYTCTNNNDQLDGISFEAHTSVSQDFYIDGLYVYTGDRTAYDLQFVAETMEVGSSLLRAVNGFRLLSESMNMEDIISRRGSFTRGLDEAIEITKGILRNTILRHVISDTEEIADSILRSDPIKVISEILYITGSLLRKTILCRKLSETERIYENIYGGIFLLMSLQESLEIADSIINRCNIRQIINTVIEMIDSLSRSLSLRKILIEVLNVSDLDLGKRVVIQAAVKMIVLYESLVRYIIKLPYGGLGVVLADTGAKELMKIYFNNIVPIGGRNLTFRLYMNNYTPNEHSVLSNFIEAAGGGYTPRTLLNGYWTTKIYQGLAEALYLERVFQFTGPLNNNATIYGYYVTDMNETLIYAERSEFPFQPLNNGDHFDINPRFRMSKGVPS